jgi:hypothetical protein
VWTTAACGYAAVVATPTTLAKTQGEQPANESCTALAPYVGMALP